MTIKREKYRDKGIQEVYNTPYEKKLKKLPWIQDKRVRERYLRPEEENKILDDLVCLKCGEKCGGNCEDRESLRTTNIFS